MRTAAHGARIVDDLGDAHEAESTAAIVRAVPFWANPRFGLVVVIAVLILVFSSLRSAFLNVDLSLVPMQADLSVFVVVGLAQMSVLALGHMNLAVPRMAAISAFAMGWSYQHL